MPKYPPHILQNPIRRRRQETQDQVRTYRWKQTTHYRWQTGSGYLVARIECDRITGNTRFAHKSPWNRPRKKSC